MLGRIDQPLRLFDISFVLFDTLVCLLGLIVLLGLLFSIYYRTSFSYRYPSMKQYVNFLTLYIVSFFVLIGFYSPEVVEESAFGFITGTWATLLVTILSILFYIYYVGYAFYTIRNAQYSMDYSFLQLAIYLAVLVIVFSTNFIIIYLALELLNFCAYVLAGAERHSLLSVEAALKYFVLSSVSAGFMLFGISFIYGSTGGLLDILDVARCCLLSGVSPVSDSNNIYLLIGIFLLIIGLLFKIGVVPFHFWIIDVYAGSPLIITFFFSVFPKFGILFLLYKLSFFWSYGQVGDLLQFMYLTTSLLCLLLGSIGALAQTTIKRLLAYSAISNIGYVMFCFSSGTAEYMLYGFIYFLTYVIMLYGIFLLLVWVSSSNENVDLDNLYDFVGIGFLNKPIAILLSSFLLGLSALPPFLPFFSKLLIVQLCLDSNAFISLFVILLNSIITVVFYLKLINLLLFENSLPFINSLGYLGYWDGFYAGYFAKSVLFFIWLAACVSIILPFYFGELLFVLSQHLWFI